MGISHQESGATNAVRQVSVWRCASAFVLRLDYRTLPDFAFLDPFGWEVRRRKQKLGNADLDEVM